MEKILVKRLELHDFRNLVNIVFEPHHRFNIISGLNGMGKTNILEALYIFSALRSFRTTSRKELIRLGESRTVLRGEFDGTRFGMRCDVTLSEQSRRFLVNGKPLAASAEHYRQLPMVLFHPATMSIVQAGPQARRRFLDRALFQADSIYPVLHRDYMRALANRNRLLKKNPLDRQALDAFDPQIAEIGIRIIDKRREFLETIRPHFRYALNAISLGLAGELTYCPKVEGDAGRFLDALKEGLHRDSARGFTSIGPHADDVAVHLDLKLAKSYASQGQQRIIALALKIAETRAIAQSTMRVPVLLLDDVSSELDQQRNKKLFDFLSEVGGQVFITTTHTEFIKIEHDRRDYSISDGVLSDGGLGPAARHFIQ